MTQFNKILNLTLTFIYIWELYINVLHNLENDATNVTWWCVIYKYAGTRVIFLLYTPSVPWRWLLMISLIHFHAASSVTLNISVKFCYYIKSRDNFELEIRNWPQFLNW